MIDDPLIYSRETRQLLDNHTSLTEVQLKNLDEKITRVESAIKWAGGLIISLLLAVLGWAVVQQINANEAQKNELRQQILLLQQQQEQDRLESATRAAEAAAAAHRIGQGVDFKN